MREPNPATSILRVLCRPRDEAQLTQLLATVAADPVVAGELASLLVEAAPSENARQRAQLGTVPERLRCRAEVTLTAPGGHRHGRVDLRFDDDAHDFTLLAELKLHSGYGHDQVERYRAALDELHSRRFALLAVTRNVPGVGEPPAETPRWLGSVRWTDIYDGLLTSRRAFSFRQTMAASVFASSSSEASTSPTSPSRLVATVPRRS